MKALEILKEELEELRNRGQQYSHIREKKKKVKEAIKELEEMENRSCSNCKYNKEQDNFMIFCDCVMCEDGSKMMWHSFTKHFGCKKWENKQ